MVPDQECLTSILLNVRYAVIGWNLVSLGHSYGAAASSAEPLLLLQAGLF